MNVLHALLIRLFPGNNLLKSLLLVPGSYLYRDSKGERAISVSPLLLYQVLLSRVYCQPEIAALMEKYVTT